LRGLERLRLRYGEQAQGDGEWVAPHTRAGNSRSLGDADLAPLAALDGLISVELMGTVNLRGDGIRALAKLPKLAALRLSCFDVDDATMAAVARFPALRSLRIELVLGFAGEGMRAIAAAPRLEELTIAHCPQLSADDVAALGRCTSLTSLAIRQLTTLRNDNDRQLRDDERQHRDAAQGRSQPALTDRALMGLQTLTSLRRLELTWGSFTSMALQTLADMRRLEHLDLTGNGELVPSALAHVPATVQTLRIGDCDGLDDHAAEVIGDHLLVLRELWLSHDAKLTDAFVETALQIPSLRTLNLAGCTGLTARTGELLLAARNLAEVDITGTRFIAQPLIEQLRSQGKRVRYAAW
jgi:hypothetical protein